MSEDKHITRRIFCPKCGFVTRQTLDETAPGKFTLWCRACGNEWNFETYSAADIVMDRRRMMLEVAPK